MNDRDAHWNASKEVARMTLRSREQRRKLMFRLLLIALGLMAGGLWAVEDWLAGSPWRFLIWWGACAAVTFLTMLLALYDALAVIREERDKGSGDKK